MDSGDEFDPFDEPQDQVLDPGKYEPQSEGQKCNMRENHIEVNNMGEKYKVPRAIPSYEIPLKSYLGERGRF